MDDAELILTMDYDTKYLEAYCKWTEARVDCGIYTMPRLIRALRTVVIPMALLLTQPAGAADYGTPMAHPTRQSDVGESGS